MTNFIRDNTPLWDDKVEINPVTVAKQEWGAADAALAKQALLDTQSYLRSGVLNASSSITVDTANVTTVNATTVNTTNANAAAVVAADINLTNNASPTVGPELDWIGNRGAWFLGIDVANNPTSRDFVITGQRGSYTFNDGATTLGSAVVTSASAGGFTTALVGAAISGPGIPVGATVLSVAGPTSLTMTANATVTASGVTVAITRSSVQDLAYWKHRGALSATLGIGVTPPDGSARLQVSSQDDEPAMSTVRLRRGPAQTGNVLTIHDSGPTDKLWVDKDFFISGSHGFGCAVCIQADAVNARALLLTDNAKGSVYGFTYPGGNALRIRYMTGGFDICDFSSAGNMTIRRGLTLNVDAGSVSFARSILYTSEIAPAALGADQNDYTPTGFADAYDVLLSSSIANVNITGFGSPSNGREIYVYNSGGSNTLTLKNQSASSTAANRIIGRGNADVVLNAGQGVLLRYSTSLTRWVVRHAP